MIKLRFKRRSRFMVSLIASAAFIALAVYGWNLSLADVALFTGLCIAFLLILVGAAALCGFLLSRLQARKLERDDRGLE